MRLFEKYSQRNKGKILKKTQQDNARLLEQEVLENELKEREEYYKILEAQRQKQLNEEREKILSMTAPRPYIVEFKSKRTKYIDGKKYVYQRNDYFLCDTPRQELEFPYSQYKFKKISGENFGEIFTSVQDDEIKLVDLQGNCYKSDRKDSLLLSCNVFSNYTIKDFNEYLEIFNGILEQEAKCEEIISIKQGIFKYNIFNF